MKGDKYQKANLMAVFGLCLFVPLMGYALTLNGCWAEPEPPKEQIAFSVSINQIANTENEINLTVNELTDDLAEEMYYDSLELLACCVQAEAGNQSIEGKQLVADVVLNRVDNEDFPDSIENVIKQSGQFAVVGNGRINKVEPSPETWQAVSNEIENRQNSEVVYFKTNSYSTYGTPYRKVGDHYFSTY